MLLKFCKAIYHSHILILCILFLERPKSAREFCYAYKNSTKLEAGPTETAYWAIFFYCHPSSEYQESQKKHRQHVFAAPSHFWLESIFIFIKALKLFGETVWKVTSPFNDKYFIELQVIQLCNCYTGRCQKIGEKSAYMVGIMMDFSKQRQLIFPVQI